MLLAEKNHIASNRLHKYSLALSLFKIWHVAKFGYMRKKP